MITISSKSWHLRLVRLLFPAYQPHNMWNYLFTWLIIVISLSMLVMVIPLLLLMGGLWLICEMVGHRVRRIDSHHHRWFRRLLGFVRSFSRRVCCPIKVREE